MNPCTVVRPATAHKSRSRMENLFLIEFHFSRLSPPPSGESSMLSAGEQQIFRGDRKTASTSSAPLPASAVKASHIIRHESPTYFLSYFKLMAFGMRGRAGEEEAENFGNFFSSLSTSSPFSIISHFAPLPIKAIEIVVGGTEPSWPHAKKHTETEARRGESISGNAFCALSLADCLKRKGDLHIL